VAGTLGTFGFFLPAIGQVPVELYVALFTLLLFVIIFITKMMGYFLIIRNIWDFTYPNAFVTVKGNPCIRGEVLDRLTEARSITEAISLLKGYGMMLDAGEYVTAEEIDRSLDDLYSRECTGIEEIVPGSVRPFFRIFTMLQEIEVLKAAFRRMQAGGVRDGEAESQLVPVGSFTRPVLRKMADARNVDELIRLLQGSVYGPPLLEAFHDAGTERTTLPFERALDRFAGMQLHSALFLVDALQRPVFTHFVLSFSDITNLKILTRGVRDGLGMEALEQYLLPPGRHLPPERLQRIAEARRVREIGSFLQGTPYAAPFDSAAAMYERTGSLMPLEALLDRILLKSVSDLALADIYGPARLLAYLVAKRIELQNIRAVIWGIRNHVAPETLQLQLIREGGAA
jgi:V/A-type H+-transporting ATPase subunit C